jgi:hypothetical protein
LAIVVIFGSGKTFSMTVNFKFDKDIKRAQCQRKTK